MDKPHTTPDATATAYGATYSTHPDTFGVITAIFPVPPEWDGYRYHGYCRPTPEEVAAFLSSTPCSLS